MFTIFSTSLNPESRSRLLAQCAAEQLKEQGIKPVFYDVQDVQLPMCDGSACYADPEVQKLANIVTESKGLLIASPVYNYDVNSVAKNIIELTGQAWRDKVVGFLLSAGGSGSYMSAMGLANSLMLDFRSLVLPRFVYATPDVFSDNRLSDNQIIERIAELTTRLIKVTRALNE